jgi:hypothetical protein
MIRHDHISDQSKQQASAHFAENLNYNISITGRSKKRSALITHESNKMQIAATGDAFESREARMESTHPLTGAWRANRIFRRAQMI